MDATVAQILEGIKTARNCSAKEAAFHLAEEAKLTCFWCRGLKVDRPKCPDCNRTYPKPSDIFAVIYLQDGV